MTRPSRSMNWYEPGASGIDPYSGLVTIRPGYGRPDIPDGSQLAVATASFLPSRVGRSGDEGRGERQEARDDEARGEERDRGAVDVAVEAHRRARDVERERRERVALEAVEV